MANEPKATESTESTALIPAAQPGAYLPIMQDADSFAEAIRDNLGATQFNILDLPRLKVPPGGGLAWELPTDDGDELQRTVDGVIAFWRDARIYWPNPIEESDGRPPQCRSEDGVTGIGNPGGECLVCPFAQMDSRRDGRPGSACSQRRMVFILTPGRVLPYLLSLPITSVKPMRKYNLDLASKRQTYWSVVTSWRLERTENRDGIDYSVAIPKRVRELDAQEKAAIAAYRDVMRPVLDRVSVFEQPQASENE